MLLEQIPLRFKKSAARRKLEYSLSAPASETTIASAEQRLGVQFPLQVRSFYEHYDGLRVEDPQLEILPIAEIDFASPELLHFATLDGRHRLHFDTAQTNAAGQWNIVTSGAFCVTLTMASFWSVRMWTWIDWRRPIWHEEVFACDEL